MKPRASRSRSTVLINVSFLHSLIPFRFRSFVVDVKIQFSLDVIRSTNRQSFLLGRFAVLPFLLRLTIFFLCRIFVNMIRCCSGDEKTNLLTYFFPSDKASSRKIKYWKKNVGLEIFFEWAKLLQSSICPVSAS